MRCIEMQKKGNSNCKRKRLKYLTFKGIFEPSYEDSYKPVDPYRK